MRILINFTMMQWADLDSLGDEDSYSEEEEPDSDDSIHEFIVNDSEVEEESEEDSEDEESCHSSDWSRRI